ncbi:MAG: hypothetical protein HFI93_03950 [Lachnospiraceae bacterium]|nr:hypothetical protein [Lachnospiraceae bacterium]
MFHRFQSRPRFDGGAVFWIRSENGVEGIFGGNTSAQKDLNIELDPGEIIRHELSSSQYFPNGVLWTDLVHSSVENYE